MHHLCEDGAGLAALATPKRNRYFYGKLLDRYHFELERDYCNLKRWLLNRLTVGSGVVCGLGVRPSAEPAGHVAVEPGVALDRLGREIIVPELSRPVDPRQLTDDCGNPLRRVERGGVVNICLAYHECESDAVPALACGCETELKCEPSIIRERYRVLVHEGREQPRHPHCSLPGLFAPGQKGGPPDVQTPLVERLSGPCHGVEGGACVTLAQIRLPDEGPIEAGMIDINVRPLVYSNELLFELLLCLAEQCGSPGETLTTVTKISWKQDGEMSLDEFLDKGLVVTFSGDVTPSSPHGRAWFLVTAEHPVGQTDLSETALAPGTVFLQRVLDAKITASGNTVSFKPDPDFKKAFEAAVGRAKAKDPRALCRVVLKCDFLQDADGRAVDGDFLGGGLPSGDKVPGGDFESWFFLLPG